MEQDKLHYNTSRIDGYNRPFNFVVSLKSGGKSTAMILKSKSTFDKTGQPTLLWRRQITDITELYITGLEGVINKFTDGPKVRFNFKRGQIKDGAVDVYIGDKVIYRIIALSNPLSRIKSFFLENAAYSMMDEFISNARIGEKYLKGEASKMKEAIDTYIRENYKMRCYWFGNTYSFYNPYFVEWGIDPLKLEKGKVLAPADANWACEFWEMPQELKDYIKSNDPLYKDESNAYTQYALEGAQINDVNIRVTPTLPLNYHLCFYFYVDGKYFSLWENNALDFENQFYVGYADKVGKRRDVYCFDFKDLINQSVLFTREDRFRLTRFKQAIRSRAVAFQSLECDYLVEEIYNQL